MGPATGSLKIPVRIVRPFYRTSRGSPTVIEATTDATRRGDIGCMGRLLHSSVGRRMGHLRCCTETAITCSQMPADVQCTLSAGARRSTRAEIFIIRIKCGFDMYTREHTGGCSTSQQQIRTV
jgi:hypothetical protein